jgi:putative membrane protein
VIEIESLPAINAGLNATSAVLLTAGWLFIRRRAVTAHKVCMIAAFLVSTAFLACYVAYHALHGSTPFPGTGIWRQVYFAVLIPHIRLAIFMLPFIFVTFRRAFRGLYVEHARIARWTLPIWLYVSLTGVAVYWMLYRMNW